MEVSTFRGQDTDIELLGGRTAVAADLPLSALPLDRSLLSRAGTAARWWDDWLALLSWVTQHISSYWKRRGKLKSVVWGAVIEMIACAGMYPCSLLQWDKQAGSVPLPSSFYHLLPSFSSNFLRVFCLGNLRFKKNCSSCTSEMILTLSPMVQWKNK